MEGKHNKGIVVYTLFPELVRIRKKALIVLTWAGRNLTNRSSINHPELGAIELKTGTSFQVPLVEINDGVKVYWKESEKTNIVHFEWIVIRSKYRNKHLSNRLMDELMSRLRNKGVQYVIAGFFQEEFFYKHGFIIDKNFGGLVKDIQQNVQVN